jgi:hypothetical protein
MSELDFVPRLGALAFVDSVDFPAVQTADVLAFETRKHFVEVAYGISPKAYGTRWQWRDLVESEPAVVTVRHFNDDAISVLIDVLRDEQAKLE